jgi:hypothetical protein
MAGISSRRLGRMMGIKIGKCIIEGYSVCRWPGGHVACLKRWVKFRIKWRN